MREAAAGTDDPTSDKHTIALHNAFSRSLARLEEMRAASGARKNAPPSLAEYLAARNAAPSVSAPGPVVPSAPTETAEADATDEGSPS